MIDADTIATWRINYGLEGRTPAEAAKYWQDGIYGAAPSGAVAVLGTCINEFERLRSDYDLLKRAVNESGDCLPACDADGHAEQCPNVNIHVVLQDQQREVEYLRTERDMTTIRAENAERALERVEARLARYEEALQKIAESDYRGNCPSEIRIAQKALTPDQPTERVK